MDTFEVREGECGRRWLASCRVFCTLPAGHSGMHWSLIQIGEVEKAGEIWWDGDYDPDEKSGDE